MSNSSIRAIQAVFATRLDTLTHLLRTAEDKFEDRTSVLERRLAPDMAPLGTQVAYTCNQPRNFALWIQGKPADNLDPAVGSLEQAHDYITSARTLLLSCVTDDSKLTEIVRVDLGPTMYADLPGSDYVHEFLLPNFYFHLVTSYAILRMMGLPIGKADYMTHLVPLVRSRS